MDTDLRARYLDLLKKALTDYLHTDSAHASAMPVEWSFPKSPLKALRNRWLSAVLGRSNLLVVKDDRLSAAERQRRRRAGKDWPPYAATMVGMERLDNLQSLIGSILADNVPGDLIETGAWRGGASIFMRGVLAAHGVDDRDVWVCDSFAGLPPPDTHKHPADAGDRHHTFDFLSAGLAEVKGNFDKFGLLDDRVRFVKGLFQDTLPGLAVERLSLLRLDGDMYASTMVALETLYDKLSPGGYVVVDDYVLAPCQQAVTDFRLQLGITDEIIDIDGTGVYWRKS